MFLRHLLLSLCLGLFVAACGADTGGGDGEDAGSDGDVAMDGATMDATSDASDTDGDVDAATNSDAGDGATSSICGDGVIEGDETCDDGNATPADGCSGLCAIEPGYVCETPGQACVTSTTCGNMVVEPGEGCDDGNIDLGDGCDDTCAVESGWACDGTTCMEIEVSVCGDGLVGVGEQCDDGQDPPLPGDGCNGQCMVESGWRCPSAGQPCEPLVTEFCGNGNVAVGEGCDDGNVIPGDGCSATCMVEAGYTCDAGGCAILCGDSLVVGNEACDDGNQTGGDGCAADCRQIEAGYLCPVASGVGGQCVQQQAGAVCPNGSLEFGEQCDDGNDVPGDGCADCRLESGYRCVTPGQPCELLPTCGDGFVDVVIGEQCDDGNLVASDGCTDSCQASAGYVCPVPQVQGERLLGGSCRAIVCGDSVIEGSEQCDDGGNVNGDGCSSGCALETGWVCPANTSCLAKQCGDGVLAGFEECDNGASNGTGTAVNGVICTSDCQITPDASACGNGVVDPGEACDDGNHDLGDGCTVFCTREPTCNPPAPCTTECGDGIVFGDEECDDGNTRSGDGCSSSCVVEAGFTCEELAGTELSIPIVYRDFKAFADGGHVAFQWSPDPIDLTPKQDIWVRTTLGTADDTLPDGTSLLGKPIFKWYVECDGTGCYDLSPDAGEVQPTGTLSAAECNAIKNDPTGTRYMDQNGRNVYYCGYGAQDLYTFSQWYRDDASVNTTILDTLTLTQQAGGEYVFDDATFFPIDGLGFGDYGTTGHNFHFTSELRYWFRYDANTDATLTFRGDDDVWVFVNGKLVVDISGTHGATQDSVTINAATVDIDNNALNLIDGEVYEIVLFQAERNTSGSNYRLTLQDFSLAASTCYSTCGDGVKASNEACDFGDTCADMSTCTDGYCNDGSRCNDGSYDGCTMGPDGSTGCQLAGYCGDGVVNGGESCDDGFNNEIYGSGPMSVCAAGCVFAPFCGDGIVAVGIEACDGGSDCESDCSLTPRCGDGVLDDGELCDDGALNGTATSGCDVSCQIKCGNGSLDAGEQCDPGAGGFSSDYDGCLPTVGQQAGCVLGPRCGDGIRNGTEECDDGRNDGTYGTCAPGCVLGARCGDGTLQAPAGELCDGGAANVSIGYSVDGDGMCTSTCIPVRFCGDGAVTDGEGCDDGVNSGAPGSCKSDCSAWVELATCGDGTVDDGEECDAGAQNGTQASGCDNRCRTRCGNGVRDSGEGCDDGVNDGRYGTCGSDCQLADYCGDGSVNGPEQCDDAGNNQSNPYGEGLCTTSCRTAPYCGDGRIQEAFGEVCDGQAGCTAECKWGVII